MEASGGPIREEALMGAKNKKHSVAGLVTVLAIVAICVAYLVVNDAVPAVADSGQKEVASEEGENLAMRTIGGVSFPVNRNGQTYGGDLSDASNEDCVPDLVSVSLNDLGNPDAIGYMYKKDWQWKPPVSNPDEALEWMAAGSPRDPVPLYASDGQTQVGWWITENGVSTGRSL